MTVSNYNNKKFTVTGSSTFSGTTKVRMTKDGLTKECDLPLDIYDCQGNLHTCQS